MAGPRRGQLRRVAPALTASLAINAALLSGASIAFRHDLTPEAAYAQAAIPVAFAPPIRPPKPKLAAPPRAAPAIKSVRAPVVTADDVLPVAASAAAANGPGQLAAASGPVGGLAQLQAPPDLIDPAVTPTVDAPAYLVNPGYWQVNAIWLAVPLSYKYCLEPQNITRFLSQPCNHIYTCQYRQASLADGKAHFSGVFFNPHERYEISGGGDYSPTHVRLTVAGAGHYHIVPLAFWAAVDAHYLGPDCPANARRIKQP
ncbi:MAG TPA: hypothetical protein VGL58_10875 [Caulobacteraceae bacterium]|jgi:hypothetical protein